MSTRSSERPLGVYLVALYFVLAGFLESIQKYRESGEAISFSPIAEHSIWNLAVHTLIYLTLAYLIWHFASLGRLGALVYGYLTFGMYVVMLSIYFLWEGDTQLTVTPLFVSIAIYHVTAIIPVILYLQPKKQKKLFHVSILELLTSGTD